MKTIISLTIDWGKEYIVDSRDQDEEGNVSGEEETFDFTKLGREASLILVSNLLALYLSPEVPALK